MITKVTKPVVALKLPRGVRNVIAQAKALIAAVEANPSMFAVPSPSLATAKANLAALEAAEIAASNRTKGAVETRDVALLAVLEDMKHFKSYVQGVADASPTNAEAIITTATMAAKKPPVRTKTDFLAKAGKVSGTALLVARASANHRASYEWQWSLDQKTWNDSPPTLQAHTTVINLSVSVIHYFRYRVVTKSGPGDWSQI